MNRLAPESMQAKWRKYEPLDFWKPRVCAPYSAHTDARGLLSIHHPWAPSRRGNYGEWSCKVEPPAGWKPGIPLFVSIYQSDNYCGAWQENAWMGAQAFIGHRFKQLLVNGRVVWEQDVADDELAADEPWIRKIRCSVLDVGYACHHGVSGYHDPYRLVDITNQAVAEMLLTFRMVDKVGSRSSLKGDHYQRFSWSPCDPTKVTANFQTSVYFGDVFLTLEKKVLRPPVVKIATIRSRPRTLHLPKQGMELELISPDKLPAPGYPVRCGIPFPEGVLKDTERIALHDARGQDVSCAMQGLNHWQDGSIRWLLCEFIATGKQRYRLVPVHGNRAPSPTVRVKTSGRGISVTNGVINLDFGKVGQSSVIAKVSRCGGITCEGMHFTIKLNCVGWREEYISCIRSVKVERAGPVCVVVRVDGTMLSEGKRRFGPFRARFEIWAGLPYLIGEWRLINESDQAMAMLLDWSARLKLPDLEMAVVDFGPFQRGHDPGDLSVKAFGHQGEVVNPRRLVLHRDLELSCYQEQAERAQVRRSTTWVATSKRAAGFASVNHPAGGLVAAMRWFAEEYPKGLVVRPNMLSLATLPESFSAVAWGHDRPFVRIGRGEAKSQGFAIWLHDVKLAATEAERFNACVQDAPCLFDRRWFIASGALEAGPERNTPALRLWKRYATPAIERTGLDAPRLGHREYWDTAWMNNYRDRIHQGLIQLVETGEPQWLRYFRAAATHNRDVDIIHYCPEHPEWIGNCHEYGEDHTSCHPMGNIGLNVDGIIDHYLLTGDPESLAAARDLAEHVLGCESWSRSARAVGWPLAQVVRWYEHSGDRRFLRKARELVAAAATYIEPRRGIFNEMHGSYSYRGAVSFMSGYLAFGLIRYHRLTAEPRTLQLLHLLDEGLFAESQHTDGGFLYSPNPENNVVSSKPCFINALVGGLSGYLYRVTGAELHARRAVACYQKMMARRGQVGTVCMDMLPIASWMLHIAGECGRQPPEKSNKEA